MPGASGKTHTGQVLSFSTHSHDNERQFQSFLVFSKPFVFSCCENDCKSLSGQFITLGELVSRDSRGCADVYDDQVFFHLKHSNTLLYFNTLLIHIGQF